MFNEMRQRLLRLRRGGAPLESIQSANVISKLIRDQRQHLLINIIALEGELGRQGRLAFVGLPVVTVEIPLATYRIIAFH